MKTVLYVTENLAAPVSGGSAATMGVLRALHRGGWSVHIIQAVRRNEWDRLELARSLSTTFTPIARPRLRVPPLAGWISTLGRLGYAPRWQPEMWRAVDAALRGGGIDLLFLDTIRAAEYGRLAKEAGYRVPIALRENNVEFEINGRLADEARGWHRLETRLRAHRYREIETHLSRYCDLVLPISEVDGAKLAALNPGLPSVAFPSPVDTDHYTPAAGPPAGKEIVFVGGMRYGPNLDGVTWFVEEVLPAVIARHPDVRLTVVGEKPPEWLVAHAPHVQAVGFVPDEREYVKRGRVFVAPIRYGSGVRTKILNALAMRRPVVATTIGAEGLHLAAGREIVVEDDAGRFAEAVNGLLADDARAAALADEGLRAMRATYAPEAVAARLREALAQLGV